MALKFIPITNLTVMNKVFVNVVYTHGTKNQYSSSHTEIFAIHWPEDIQLYIDKLKEIQKLISDKRSQNIPYPKWFQKAIIDNEGVSVPKLPNAKIHLELDCTDDELMSLARIDRYTIEYYDRFGHQHKVEEDGE